MKRHLAFLALAVFTIAGAFAQPSTTAPMKPRADGYYWITDAPGADFDEKLLACYEANQKATPDVIRIRIDWAGKPWIMKKPVDWRPKNGNQLRVHIEDTGVWSNIEYQGPGGTSGTIQPIWRFWGMKESTFSLRGFSKQNYVAWVVQATDPICNSAGDNNFYRTRFQPWDGTVGCVGIWIGYSSDPKSHNDNSCVTIDQCSMQFYPSGSGNNNGASGVMLTSLAAGHRFIVFSSYNTTANIVRDSNSVNCWGITTKGFRGQDPGGSSLMVDNFGTSGAPLVFDLNIGFVIAIRGGRHELGGQALLQGFPAQGNGNAGIISISDTQFEDFRPAEVAPFLGTNPHSMVSVHDASNLTMTNVRVWDVGDQGQTIYPDWLSLWNDSKLFPSTAVITNCIAMNDAGVNAKPVAFKPRVIGTVKRVVDGAVSTGMTGTVVQN